MARRVVRTVEGVTASAAKLAVLALSAAAALALPRAAHADEEAVQRALLERQQQSDAFALQLRQYQQRLQAPPARQPELEAVHLQQRQRLDSLNDQQRAELRAPVSEAATGAAWGPRLEARLPQLEQERRMELDRK